MCSVPMTNMHIKLHYIYPKLSFSWACKGRNMMKTSEFPWEFILHHQGCIWSSWRAVWGHQRYKGCDMNTWPAPFLARCLLSHQKPREMCGTTKCVWRLQEDIWSSWWAVWHSPRKTYKGIFLPPISGHSVCVLGSLLQIWERVYVGFL